MHLLSRSIVLVTATLGLIFITGGFLEPDLPGTSVVGSRAEIGGFALVELFTSQGCSSCPAADRFLSQLVQESGEQSQKVYALSFHVDYWDRLGWKDPYSQKLFTERQHQYARAFGTSQIYTPQMVVNGREEFVGSQKEKGRGLVEKALQENAELEIELLTLRKSEGNLIIESEINSGSANLVMNFALVEKDISTRVTKGENGGKTLQHDNVVRDFRSVKLDAKGKAHASLQVPLNLNKANAAVVAYVQDPNSMKILAATSLPI